MGKITESALRTALNQGRLARAYFLYGEEDFLTQTYTDKIIYTAVPPDGQDMNLVVYRELPDNISEISDYLDNIPFFSEYKCVLIKDIDLDAIDNNSHKQLLAIIEQIPDTAVLIFEQKTYPSDLKKLKAKTKKLLEACEKFGESCEFKPLPPAKLADMTVKKFTKLGCTILPENAQYLAEECGGSLTVLQTEIEKLATYKISGEVTREDIEKLVPKRVTSNVYNLAKELLAGRTGSALKILDALFVQRTDPIMIMAALSGHFVDLYRARLGIEAGAMSNQTAKAFGYPPNRQFAMDYAYKDARYLSAEYLGQCILILYRTNKKINSSNVNKRVLLERSLTEISILNK